MTNIINKSEINIPYLDGWRGLAIIFVLIGHFGPEQLFSCGAQGVLLFFVLSGFFMSNLLFIKKVPLSYFFVRRFSRVIPTLWLYIILMAGYAYYFQYSQYKVSLEEFLATLTFIRTYYPHDNSIFANFWPIGHLWSLNVEEHCYLYLAAGMVLVAKSKEKISPQAFLIVSVCTILCIRIFYTLGYTPSGASPWLLRSEYAALGLIASATYHVVLARRTKTLHRKSIIFLFFGFVFIYIASQFAMLGAASSVVRSVIIPLFAAFMINHASDFPQLLKKILSLKILRWFGVCSYSIYLWQQPLYMMVTFHRLSSLLGLSIALGIGACSFYFFENPIRLYLNKCWFKYQQNRIMLYGLG